MKVVQDKNESLEVHVAKTLQDIMQVIEIMGKRKREDENEEEEINSRTEFEILKRPSAKLYHEDKNLYAKRLQEVLIC